MLPKGSPISKNFFAQQDLYQLLWSSLPVLCIYIFIQSFIKYLYLLSAAMEHLQPSCCLVPALRFRKQLRERTFYGLLGIPQREILQKIWERKLMDFKGEPHFFWNTPLRFQTSGSRLYLLFLWHEILAFCGRIQQRKRNGLLEGGLQCKRYPCSNMFYHILTIGYNLSRIFLLLARRKKDCVTTTIEMEFGTYLIVRPLQLPKNKHTITNNIAINKK